MRRKSISVFLMILIVSLTSVISFAGEDLSISLTNATDMVNNNSDAVDDLEKQMEDIWDQHNDMVLLTCIPGIL